MPTTAGAPEEGSATHEDRIQVLERSLKELEHQVASVTSQLERMTRSGMGTYEVWAYEMPGCSREHGSGSREWGQHVRGPGEVRHGFIVCENADKCGLEFRSSSKHAPKFCCSECRKGRGHSEKCSGRCRAIQNSV